MFNHEFMRRRSDTARISRADKCAWRQQFAYLPMLISGVSFIVTKPLGALNNTFPMEFTCEHRVNFFIDRADTSDKRRRKAHSHQLCSGVIAFFLWILSFFDYLALPLKMKTLYGYDATEFHSLTQMCSLLHSLGACFMVFWIITLIKRLSFFLCERSSMSCGIFPALCNVRTERSNLYRIETKAR
jgi:hypothetical protein